MVRLSGLAEAPNPLTQARNQLGGVAHSGLLGHGSRHVGDRWT